MLDHYTTGLLCLAAHSNVKKDNQTIGKSVALEGVIFLALRQGRRHDRLNWKAKSWRSSPRPTVLALRGSGRMPSRRCRRFLAVG
jgi:hypothetical protein